MPCSIVGIFQKVGNTQAHLNIIFKMFKCACVITTFWKIPTDGTQHKLPTLFGAGFFTKNNFLRHVTEGEMGKITKYFKASC